MDQRTPKNSPLPIWLFLHAIERHHETAVGANQQHRLSRLAVDDTETGKSPRASRAVNRLIKAFHDRQKIFRVPDLA
jgi:hypothetical protein